MTPVDTQCLQILIVEDDKATAEVIGRHIEPIKEAFPHAIITAVHEWHEAEAVLNTDPTPNIVLLDLTIPGSQMLQTIARVDAIEERSAVVIITGAKKSEVEGGFKSPVEILIKDPSLWKPGAIIRAILRALERKDRERETEFFKGLRQITAQLKSHGYGEPSQHQA